MFTNRFLVVISVISLLLVTLAVSSPRPSASAVPDQGASDFHQRHPAGNLPVRSFSAEQIRREYSLGERYGETPQAYAREQTLREYWLGERYGETPQVSAREQALREYWLGERYGQTP